MKEKEFLTSKELATRWRIAEGTLGKWRHQGRGPSYTKIESVVLYAIDDILDFEEMGSIQKPEDELYQ